MGLPNLLIAASFALGLGACATVPASKAPLSPEAALVQRQLDAYNAHDLEGFLATYSPDIEIFDLGLAEAQSVGIPAMRDIYGRMFESMPHLRCELGNRISDGAYIVDHEICTLWEPGETPSRAIAIYQVEDNLIRRVWFAPLD